MVLKSAIPKYDDGKTETASKPKTSSKSKPKDDDADKDEKELQDAWWLGW
jgi:hypothetical protein